MDEKAVAQMIQEVHMQSSSSRIYNNEISLSSVIALAYYSGCRDYTLVRELPTGNVLLVGINYEKKNKKHECRIEKLETSRRA